VVQALFTSTRTSESSQNLKDTAAIPTTLILALALLPFQVICVGPIVKFRFSRFEPFVESMFGGAHSNFYGNLYNKCGGSCASTSPSNNAFDFIIGGGVDIPFSSKVAIRLVEFDYLLTRFGNAFTAGNNNQSNFRYQAGYSVPLLDGNRDSAR